MTQTNTTISEIFIESLKNAYGSKRNFERELLYKAYQYGNKGRMYFGLTHFLNFIVYPSSLKDQFSGCYPLLELNLDSEDLSRTIAGIDYDKLSYAYLKIRRIIES